MPLLERATCISKKYFNGPIFQLKFIGKLGFEGMNNYIIVIGNQYVIDMY